MSYLPPDVPSKTQRAIDRILADYKDVVSIADKDKDLIKYGKNALIGTSEADVMQLPAGITTETLPASNLIDSLSTNDADAAGTVRVEGHYFDDDGNKIFKVQFPTLDGQNRAALSQPLCRMTRIRKVAGSTVLAANKLVYGYDDTGVTLSSGVPDIDAQVHCIMDSNEGSSLKGASSISYEDYYLVEALLLGVNKKTAASVDFRLRVAEAGGDFITVIPPITLTNTTGSKIFWLPEVLVIPKNADFKVTAVASTTAVEVTCGVFGPLAKVVRG